MIGFVGDFGRFEYFPRYNGFLNDPNQFAFTNLCLLLMIMVSTRGNKFFASMLFMVNLLTSFSRSGLLGFISFVIFRQPLLIFGVIPVGVFVIPAGLVESVFHRIKNVDWKFELWQRGFYRLYEFPENIILGAGKGEDIRFGYGNLEIHSTPVAILFYFGIVGFFFYIFMFCYRFGKGSHVLRACLLGLLMYSMTTYSLRTPTFWFTIGILYVVERRGVHEKTCANSN